MMAIFIPDVIGRVLQYVGLRDMDSLLMVNWCFQHHIIYHPICRKRRTRFLDNWKRVAMIIVNKKFRHRRQEGQAHNSADETEALLNDEIEYILYKQKSRIFQAHRPCLFFPDSHNP